jgi:Raf kinase inhibitor-like YbhB/YbcL family protein
MPIHRRAFVLPAFILSTVIACDPEGSGPAPSAPAGMAMASITVTSKSFPGSGQIPVDLTCDGKDTSPQITWSSPPEGTKALVIIVNDLDASHGSFTHWLVVNLPPTELALAEGADPTTLGAKIGVNGFHNLGYNGPCPPHGQMHRYAFEVFAADKPLDLNEGATRGAVEGALSGHVLGAGSLIGLFAH